MNEEKVISSPVARTARVQRRAPPTRTFTDSIAPYFPDLKKKLALAGIQESPSAFLERALIASAYVSVGLALVAGVVFYIYYINVLFALAAFPFIAIGTFFYFMLYPEAKTYGRQKDIETELVFAGRHILIALRAGMPLFDSLVGVSSGYGAVSEEFRRVVEKINLGVPMGQAIREAGANSPSNEFSRIMMQLSNALSSGADVADSLEVVLNQIAREQAISLKAYGQKLNPLIMFFMIFGIIFPSLGVAFAIILFSLVSGGSLGITSTSLLYVIALIAIIQFMFLSFVESSRPRYVM